MTNSASFHVRVIYTFAPDRIYRIEVRNGAMYFLRIGGQFDLDRGQRTPGVPGTIPAVMILAAGEALFRKHRKEELVARDPTKDPEELLAIHPHNFKLGATEIKSAKFLPRKWLLSLFRIHFGRLVIEQADGQRQEYHFERVEDLQSALEQLGTLLGDKVEKQIRWDEQKSRFVKSG